MAEVCHIKGEQPSSARFDPSQDADERRSFENLILMCPTHHTKIDKNPSRYTVDWLLAQKSTHETMEPNVGCVPEDDAVAKVIHNLEQTITIHGGSAITTINQSGGQVAHSITNLGRQPRVLSESAIEELAMTLAQHAPQAVSFVSSPIGDDEAAVLKRQIIDLLTRAGWSAGQSRSVMDTTPPRGGVEISAPPDHAAADALLDALVAAGLDAAALVHTGNPFYVAVRGQH